MARRTANFHYPIVIVVGHVRHSSDHARGERQTTSTCYEEVYKVRMFLRCQHALRKAGRIRYKKQYVLVQLISRY